MSSAFRFRSHRYAKCHLSGKTFKSPETNYPALSRAAYDCGTEKGYAVNANRTIASVLSLIAPLFSLVTQDEYRILRETVRMQDVRDAWGAQECDGRDAGGASNAQGAWECLATVLGNDAEQAACCERAFALPSWQVRSLLQNEVLVAGMPLATLPVESLYKPWSSEPGNAYGAQRGLYLGDPARHVQSVYQALQIKVPERFAATPDHMALLLDLLGLFLESGNSQAARDLAADHFDWLGDYDVALARTAVDAAQAPAYDAAKRALMAEGIAHLRALTAVVDRLAKEIRADARAAAQAATREPLAACGDVR